MLDIGKVLFPCGRQVDEILAVGFPAEAARGAVGALVVFTLMPQDATDAVGELCLLYAPEQAAINCRRILGIVRVPLVLVDACAPYSPVDEANGNTLVFHQAPGQIESPVADGQAILGRPADGVPPRGASWIPPHASVAAYPLVGLGKVAQPPIRRHGVGLSIDQVGITTDHVGNSMQHHFAPVDSSPKLHLVAS